MWRLSLKSMLANKFRVMLTSLAVVLGVSFVVASFVLSDGLSDSFGNLSREIYEGTDLVVEAADSFGSTALDESTLATISDNPGVREAVGSVGSDGVQPVRADGTILDSFGPPLIGTSWVDDADLNQLTLVEGAAPSPGTFVMDTTTAEREGFVVGETYEVVTATGSTMFELSGLVRFGTDNALNGAVITSYDIADAREMLAIEPGVFEEISISVLDTATASDVEIALAAELGPDVQIANQQTLQDEQAAEFNEGINILRNVLLGFAGVSLFVSTFIISNTFGMVLAQRVREIGLLRALGTERRQIRRGILIEALSTGLVASIVGIAAGVGLTAVLRWIFDLLGAGLPPADLILAPRTIAIALALGVGATVVASLLPARRAAKISPIAALTGADDRADESSRLRPLIGAAITTIGLVLGGVGLAGVGGTATVIALLATGAAAVFLGIATLSPSFASPVIGALGWPAQRALGVSGKLARQNARRHPRRTATTAASLMIGLSLVTTAMVVGESIKAQIASTLETSVDADYLIAHQNFDSVPNSITTELEAIPEIGTLSDVSEVPARIDGEETWFETTDLAVFTTLFDLNVADGQNIAFADNSALLPVSYAKDRNLAVGDQLSVEFENGAAATFDVAATYADESVVSEPFLNRPGVEAVTDVPDVGWIAATVTDGVTAADADAAIRQTTSSYPQLNVQSSAQYRESIEAEIDGLLMVINAMLALAIAIALVGIGLTLALGVVERTRELGLLRAVGMTRRQMRRMVRWEAAAIALFGAVLGTAVGLLFGWSAVMALPDAFITTVAVPFTRLGVLLLVSAAAGLFAAILPAYRAGRLNVLDAISHS